MSHAAVLMLGLTFAAEQTDPGLTIAWEKNMLTISGPDVPGKVIPINYLEAYCRSGSTNQDWHKTTIPHKTKLVSASPKEIRLRCEVQPSVTVDHRIVAGADEVTFHVTATNHGDEFVDVQWVQPCMRVKDFTGLGQEDYFRRCFIYTDRGLTLLHKTKRSTEALYTPGQVYVPVGIDPDDVNPRPISPEKPVNGLIGAFSADGKKVVAMAWNDTQELFQGVIVCIHSDFRIGGLKPGETKKLLGKVYIVDDEAELLKRYRRDFEDK